MTPADELQEQATDFLRNPKKARPARVAPIASAPAPPRDHDAVSTVALAWFPTGDYERALALWPDFADSELVNGPGGHLPHDGTVTKCSRNWSDTPNKGPRVWQWRRSK